MKKLIITVVFVLAGAGMCAQSLIMGCTATDTSGNITIKWAVGNIPVGYKHRLFASNSLNGPYAILYEGGNAYNPNALDTNVWVEYTHTGANGDIQQWFYYVQLYSLDAATTYTSDTIGSLLMVLTNNGIGTADLDWLTPYPNATGSCVFDILKQRGDESTVYDTTSLYAYKDTIHECGEQLGYCVQLRAQCGGCYHQSMWQTDIFTDFISPSIPQLDTVSINPVTQQVELGWKRPEDKDIWGYIVYVFQDGIWNVVDTVWGAENTHYIDTENSSEQVQQYRICSIDTCRNASPLGDVHVTILTTALPDKCKEKVVVSWNAYQNMPGGVTDYIIYASENAGPYMQVGRVAGTQLSFTHANVDVKSVYTYYVKAVNADSGFSASTLKIDVEFNRVYSQGSVLLRYVSVVDSNKLEIAFYVPDTINYKQFMVYKTIHGKSNFSLFQQLNKKGSAYYFTDTSVNTGTQNAYYYAAITDECDEVFALSDTVCNFILTSSESSADLVELQWQPYEGFQGRLELYSIERQTQSETAMQHIDDVNINQSDYCDNVWDYATDGAKFYYRVVAEEGKGNPYGFQDKSYSNIIEVVKTPIVWVPNTFHPHSEIAENQTFHPVLSYVSTEDYLFSVYDRWGLLVFKTTDMEGAWDGNVDGKPAAMGVYVYRVQYRLNNQKIEHKQGTVTLIR